MEMSTRSAFKILALLTLVALLFHALHVELQKSALVTMSFPPPATLSHREPPAPSTLGRNEPSPKPASSSSAAVVSEDDFEQVEAIMAKRRKHLAEACFILGWDGMKEGRTRFFFANKYDLAYCSVPKTGCTNFKKLLWLLNGKVENISEISKYANTSTFHERTRQLYMKPRWAGLPDFARNHTKFVVVRHPFERLVSAYHNKLVPLGPGRPAQFAQLGEEIRARYGATQARRDAIGETPTFEELVDYVTNETLAGRPIEDHFSTVNPICWPCAINFDVIAHVETLPRDVRYLLRKIGAPDRFYQMQNGYSSSGGPQSTSQKSLAQFAQVPLSKVARLYTAIRSDFILFGYDASAYFERD